MMEAAVLRNHIYEPVPKWLKEVPDNLKIQGMCEKAMRINPVAFFLIPDRLKTQEMCDAAACMEPYFLASVPNRFKTQKMCDKAVREERSSLQFVPDWYVTQQQTKIWHDHRLIKWYRGYKKRKAQKAKIKEELLPIAWHPSRWWDWCVPEVEKKRRKIFF